MKSGGIKEYIFIIAGVIYVLAMFPLFFIFQANPGDMYSAYPQDMLLISEGGALLIMVQFLIGALIMPGKKKQ
ncbi:MAG: hypothetical protein JRN15_01940 [Nitrososphaerota archaeon]|nr:hypothetical protein [Nitrososphaerota archaeon]